MRRSTTTLAVLLLVLAGACSTDGDDDETTTDGPTTTADETTSAPSPAGDGLEGLDPLPGVALTVTFAVDGGRLVMEGTVSNGSDDDVAVLPLDATTEVGEGRMVAVRAAAVDGDEAPPQVEAVFVAAGASVTMTEELGSLANAPTGDVTVCLEGDMIVGGPAPSGYDPPTVRIGPRGDAAGVVCSDPAPTGL